MKLRFTPRALENLNAISDYIKRRSPAGSRNVRQAIDGTLQLLLRFPLSGRRQETDGVRKMVTRRYGYVIYYLVDQPHDELIVLSVKHGAQAREHEDR